MTVCVFRNLTIGELYSFFVDLATIFSQLKQEVNLKKLDKNGIILET